jgi:hypothetical protein
MHAFDPLTSDLYDIAAAPRTMLRAPCEVK